MAKQILSMVLSFVWAFAAPVTAFADGGGGQVDCQKSIDRAYDGNYTDAMAYIESKKNHKSRAFCDRLKELLSEAQTPCADCESRGGKGPAARSGITPQTVTAIGGAGGGPILSENLMWGLGGALLGGLVGYMVGNNNGNRPYGPMGPMGMGGPGMMGPGMMGPGMGMMPPAVLPYRPSPFMPRPMPMMNGYGQGIGGYPMGMGGYPINGGGMAMPYGAGGMGGMPTMAGMPGMGMGGLPYGGLGLPNNLSMPGGMGGIGGMPGMTNYGSLPYMASMPYGGLPYGSGGLGGYGSGYPSMGGYGGGYPSYGGGVGMGQPNPPIVLPFPGPTGGYGIRPFSQTMYKPGLLN